MRAATASRTVRPAQSQPLKNPLAIASADRTSADRTGPAALPYRAAPHPEAQTAILLAYSFRRRRAFQPWTCFK
jgi:hypothetical protein